MGERIRLILTSMAQGGEALGRDDSGRVVFVPYAIAGERVLIEIVEEKKGYVRGRLLEVLEPSPSRVAPRCAHFGPRVASPDTEGDSSAAGMVNENGKSTRARSNVGCGGCQWQHIAYAAQVAFKTGIVREQFARIGKFPDAPVHETLGAGDPWHYRNNVQFRVDAAGHLCFRAFESHDLIPIRECHILHPLLDEMFRNLELATDLSGVTLRAGTTTGQKMLVLEGGDEPPPTIAVDEPVSVMYQTRRGSSCLIGKDALHEDLAGRSFRVSPSSFFQVNTAMAEKLVDLVLQYLAPQRTETLLDLFAGVGTFGLLLAPRVARVIEIEQHRAAVDDARANAVDLHNVEFHCALAEEALAQVKSRIDLAVADPPRAGFAPRALDALVAAAPRVVAYVSCDPASLARDARRFVDGGYRLTDVQPVDLFPQTYHVESVSRFERGAGRR